MNPAYPGPFGSPNPVDVDPIGHTPNTPIRSDVAPKPAEDRSVIELLSALVSQTGTLVRKEIDLAKTELSGKLNKVLRDAVLVGSGAACAFLAALVLVAALVFALGTVMPMWASALVVGLVFAAVAAALVISGIQAIKKVDPLPRATVETLEEDRKWVQQLTHR